MRGNTVTANKMNEQAASTPLILQTRLATVADVPHIMEIRFAVTENRLSDPGKVSAQLCCDYLDALGRGWVCEAAGEIIGFSYAAKNGSIWALFVLPKYEGHGAGSQLLAEAVEWLFAEGHQEIWLSTGTNTRAERFYAAQGWQRGEQKAGDEVVFRLRPC